MGGFNTQPPEGGWTVGNHDHIALAVSTHSRPKVAGPDALKALITGFKFQHTAARRLLTVLQTAIRERRCFNTERSESSITNT